MDSLSGPRIFCLRDDYAFLPPGATGGLPCDAPPGTTASQADPHQVALELLDRLGLPSVTLDMNPRKGLVRLPTWFWAEGYDGRVLQLADTLVLEHQECQRVIERDERGDAILDETGQPVVDRVCTPVRESLGVEVRVWPKLYRWSFGDGQEQRVTCDGVGPCPKGLGRAYTDPETPSPIQHAYVWTSLGQNGEEDAYSIRLAITFGAQYRFSHNGGPLSSWLDLREREVAWTAKHQVQEVQAVLGVPRGPERPPGD